MNISYLYHPYKSQGCIVPFVYCISAFAFVISGYCVSENVAAAVFWLILGSVCTFFAKTLYDSTKTTIAFSDRSFLITGDRHNCCHSFTWETFAYAYYCKNYKGHIFLLLSSKHLDENHVRKIINKSANSSKMCVDSFVVIHIDTTQDVSQLKALINNKVPIINQH